MGRRKIEIRAIKDDRNRSVTFLKRKGGLFKKAHELSVLCSVDVAVIIFGHNKKLYEFSSGDIAETLRRYQYYGQAHEHKGPGDFKGKGGGDDDEDEDEDEDISHGREDSMPPQHPPGIPPHLQHHSSYPHLRQPAASASPPIPNGMFQPRHPTPQPSQMGSRPSSRNTIRRTSSNLIPMHHPTPPPPPQNGFAYAPNPPNYNPNAGPPPHPSPQPQFQQFPPHVQQPPPPQGSHQQIQQAHQAYIQEQRRMSQPQNGLQPPQQPASRTSPQPEQQQSLRPPEAISPPHPKHLSSKSRSIFTPIDDGGSVLAQHFFGAPEPPRRHVKREGSPDIKPPPRAATAPRSFPQQSRSQSHASEFPPPSRTNTGGSKSGARPKLNLQIPSEASDNESATGSPHQSGGGVSANPARGSSDSHHSGLVLPPPSPSASAVLSAGASGPPNPFARPPPPTSSSQNTNAYTENRNNIDTPMSALPSRFIADNLLPSPGGFYDWDNFGRNGLNSAVLPSPLTFPTPINASGPNFARGEEGLGEKRKGSEERIGEAKKLKT